MAVMETVVQIEGNTEWKVGRARSGQLLGICDALGLTVESDTWANLMEDIAQTLNAMLHDLTRTGDFERFLRDRNWRPVRRPPESLEGVWFDVPFTTRTAGRDSKAALR
jgi:hypothetical protein